MSCNYYIHTKDVGMVMDLAPRVAIDTDNREFEVHLCQTAIGWKTLFECHNYSSFKDLVTILRDRRYEFTIKDNHGNIFDKEQFISCMKSRQENHHNRTRINSECDTGNIRIFADDDGYEFIDCEFD